MIGRLGARICDGISKSSWKCSRWNINTRPRVCKFRFLFSLAKLRITTIIDGGRGEGERGGVRHDDELVAGMNQMNKYSSQLNSCFAIWSWACSMVCMTQTFQEFVINKMFCCPINAAVWRQKQRTRPQISNIQWPTCFQLIIQLIINETLSHSDTRFRTNKSSDATAD